MTTTEILTSGEITVLGQVTSASNIVLLAEVRSGGESRYAAYKPVRGERPLWDFPHGTLAGRELASHLIGASVGWAGVPITVLRDGPYGPGSVQEWIGDPYADNLVAVVDVVARGEIPSGWLRAADGQTPEGSLVSVVHEDREDLRSMAVMDAVLNNSDRKGSHCVRDTAGRLWGFDHGLTLHEDDKLRTVLWGWAGMPLREPDLSSLRELAARLDEIPAPGQTDSLVAHLADLLTRVEVDALRRRVLRLLDNGCHPHPSGQWPAVPWPAL